jgi:hypothetical protein
MTDLSNKIPIPPLHELSADRLEARKNHLLAEITPAAKSRVTRRARRARLVVLLAARAHTWWRLDHPELFRPGPFERWPIPIPGPTPLRP